VRSLLSNTNYQTILAIILRTGPQNSIHSKDGWVARQYIFKQLWGSYVPTRTKKPNADTPVQPVTYKRGRKPANELTHATFSGLMATIRDAGLVAETTAPGNRKEKVYRITDHGETAFRFFSNPATSSLVQSLLEKN
jgi:hypothetical protein